MCVCLRVQGQPEGGELGWRRSQFLLACGAVRIGNIKDSAQANRGARSVAPS